MSLGLPMPFVKHQFFTAAGVPAAGYRLWSFVTGGSTPTDTYTTSALTSPTQTGGTQGLALDSGGMIASGEIFLDPAVIYDFYLTLPAATNVNSPVWSAIAIAGALSPAISVPATFELDAIGSTSTDAIIIRNVTAAGNAAQQFSGRVRFTGSGWNPTASAARVVDALIELVPYQQASGDPLLALVVSTQVNAGGYNPTIALGRLGLSLASTTILGWASTGVITPDILLSRAAANVLKLTNLAGTGGACVDLGTADTVTIKNIANAAAGSLSVKNVLVDNAGTIGYTDGKFTRTGSAAVSFTAALSSTSTIAERSRTYAMGAVQTRAFNAANYTSDSGTWVVGAGDVLTEMWSVVGDTIWFSLSVATTTITATPAQLQVQRPTGFTIVRDVKAVALFDDGLGAGWLPAIVTATASNDFAITKVTGNFGAVADAAKLFFQIAYQVS